MKYKGTAIVEHEVVFCIREHEGRPAQHLTIAPVAYLDYGDEHWQADYVMIEVRVVVLNSQIVVDEHLPVGTLIRLYDHLVMLKRGSPGVDTFLTVDGQLQLTIESREKLGDVRFSGRIPSFEFDELTEHPLRLRDALYRILFFEFALELETLSKPLSQLHSLLELARRLKQSK